MIKEDKEGGVKNLVLELLLDNTKLESENKIVDGVEKKINIF